MPFHGAFISIGWNVVVKAGAGAVFLDYEAILALEAKPDRVNLGLETSVEQSRHSFSTASGSFIC